MHPGKGRSPDILEKLIAAAPIKDPATGSLKAKVFTVEARAAFIEATTASSVNHENAV